MPETTHVGQAPVGADPYVLSAECIDIMIAETWEGSAPEVKSVLKGLRASEGLVVDLGAGSGRGGARCSVSPPRRPGAGC
jgi:hypothetical protein